VSCVSPERSLWLRCCVCHQSLPAHTTCLCVCVSVSVSLEDHSSADCLACVILSHGDRGDVIYATNGTLPLHSIVDMFKPDRCPSLAGKPKLFFIQVTDRQRDRQTDRLPTQTDIIQFATTPLCTSRHVHMNIFEVIYFVSSGLSVRVDPCWVVCDSYCCYYSCTQWFTCRFIVAVSSQCLYFCAVLILRVFFVCLVTSRERRRRLWEIICGEVVLSELSQCQVILVTDITIRGRVIEALTHVPRLHLTSHI